MRSADCNCQTRSSSLDPRPSNFHRERRADCRLLRDVGHGRQGEEPTRQPPLTILRAMQMIAILPIGTSALRPIHHYGHFRRSCGLISSHAAQCHAHGMK